MAHNEGWLTLITYKTTLLGNYIFIKFHLQLHYNIDNACEYIIFVRCLYTIKAKSNKQTIGEQHSGVILGLTSFLMSHSKPDHICPF